MGVYDHVKQLCDDRGIAVTQLEKELGFGRGSIGKMRKSKPSADRLQKIADYFGVPVGCLFVETGTPMYADPQAYAEGKGEVYYLDPDTAELAQRLFEDPKYRVLFDAAEGAPAEDLQVAADMLRRFKEARGE